MPATTPRERPILFSGPMVRAILEGRKTQTRRVVKPQPTGGPTKLTFCQESRGAWLLGKHLYPCPYGVPGDRLWVRETWGYRGQFYSENAHAEGPVIYRADGLPTDVHGERWRPSIHMPRRVCRLELDIARVRVERFQDITDADAMAEGIKKIEGRAGGKEFNLFGLPEWDELATTPREAFRMLLESVGRGKAWTDNDWCWVVDFTRTPQG